MTIAQSGNRELAALWQLGPKGRKQALAYCEQALRACNGNVLRAAEMIRVHRATLHRYITSTEYGAPELQNVLQSIRNGARKET